MRVDFALATSQTNAHTHTMEQQQQQQAAQQQALLWSGRADWGFRFVCLSLCANRFFGLQQQQQHSYTSFCNQLIVRHSRRHHRNDRVVDVVFVFVCWLFACDYRLSRWWCTSSYCAFLVCRFDLHIVGDGFVVVVVAFADVADAER